MRLEKRDRFKDLNVNSAEVRGTDTNCLGREADLSNQVQLITPRKLTATFEFPFIDGRGLKTPLSDEILP